MLCKELPVCQNSSFAFWNFLEFFFFFWNLFYPQLVESIYVEPMDMEG